jgi:hypothetical protein
MIYSLKIIPSSDLNKIPPYVIQVEEVSQKGVSSLAELTPALVTKLNQYLFEHDIEIDTGIFDKAEESVLFHPEQEKGQEPCPYCNK